jgi:hypothetical protein
MDVLGSLDVDQGECRSLDSLTQEQLDQARERYDENKQVTQLMCCAIKDKI